MRALLCRGKGGLCCVAALLLLQPAFGQSIDMHFERVPIDLSNNSVRAIFQDHEGYLWFGTYEGQNRWDGFEIVTYKHDPLDSTSLADNEITDILEDGENRLWVGTMTGVHIFDRARRQFLRMPINAEFPHNRGVRLRLGSAGRVWVIAEFSIHVFDFLAEAFQPVWQSKSDSGPVSIVVDGTGTLRFSLYDGTLYQPKRGDSNHVQVDSLAKGRVIHAMARSADARRVYRRPRTRQRAVPPKSDYRLEGSSRRGCRLPSRRMGMSL